MELNTSELASGASTPEATPSTPVTQASTTACNTSSKATPSMGFSAEIQQMMFGFGDCRKPLIESASLIEQIVHQQLIQALYKAEDIAKQRNGRFYWYRRLSISLKKR